MEKSCFGRVRWRSQTHTKAESFTIFVAMLIAYRHGGGSVEGGGGGADGGDCGGDGDSSNVFFCNQSIAIVSWIARV